MSESGKKKVITGLIIFLVIANIISLSALWYSLVKKDIPVPHPVMKTYKRKPDVMGFLCDRLNLDPSQIDQFNRLRKEHFDKIKTINDSARLIRKRMFDEVFKDKTDTAKINSLSKKLGNYSAIKEKYLATHFSDLKKICNKEQCKMLERLVDRSSRSFSDYERRDLHRKPIHNQRKRQRTK